VLACTHTQGLTPRLRRVLNRGYEYSMLYVDNFTIVYHCTRYFMEKELETARIYEHGICTLERNI